MPPSGEPDSNATPVCQCDDGKQYAALSQGTTPASLFQPCGYTATPQTTAASNPSECEFGANCTADTINVQAIVEQAEETFQQQELGNCSALTYHISDPGPVALSNGGSCADVFNVTLHMAWWWSENGAECQGNDVGFANCFYDTVPHYNASNCSDFSGNAYCPKPQYADFSGENATIDFYTAWNIYNFQQWSYMYYQAMFDGFSISQAQVWNTSVAFEHLKGADVALEVLLGILTFALGLISPSGWANKLPGDFMSAKSDASFLLSDQVPGEYLLRAAQQAPSLAHHLLPTGSLDDATISSDQIVSELASYVEALATVIQDVAVSVPSNLTEFTQWLSSGYFFNEPPAMDTMVTNIIQALNTYVLSQVLQANNIIVARQVDTDPYQLQFNATGKENMTGVDLDCEHGYDKNSICGQWWHDTTNNIAFSLYSSSDMWSNNIPDLETIFNEGLTTPEALFLGSQWCALGANASQGNGPEQALDSGAAVSTACLSNMAACTWNLEGQWPEFYEDSCPSQGSYMLQDCGFDGVDVPLGYLGWWLYNGATCESEE